MADQSLAWPRGHSSTRDLVHYLLALSRGRGEHSHEERHREHDGERTSHRDHTERGGRGERGERGRHRVGRGDVYAATLLLLDEQALHGYQIIQLIEERSGGKWRPSAGSVYPALQLLEDQGYIQGEQQESRRVFHLTESGRAYIESHRAEFVAARDAVTARMDTEGTDRADQFDVLDQVETAFKQVVQVGSAWQLAAARDLLVNVRRQLYRILADDEPPDSQ